MGRYQPIITICQHCAHYKAYKMDLGPSFVFARFWPTQLCQDLYMCLFISMLSIYYMDMKIYNFEIWHKLLGSPYGKGREKKVGITWKGYFA